MERDGISSSALLRVNFSALKKNARKVSRGLTHYCLRGHSQFDQASNIGRPPYCAALARTSSPTYNAKPRPLSAPPVTTTPPPGALFDMPALLFPPGYKPSMPRPSASATPSPSCAAPTTTPRLAASPFPAVRSSKSPPASNTTTKPHGAWRAIPTDKFWPRRRLQPNSTRDKNKNMGDFTFVISGSRTR